MSVTDAVDVALDVCDELANAHANGVVHGDLGLHRVRTRWPRVPGQPVDIFALSENDSGAFAFRASRQQQMGNLIAPEQRVGGIVDVRADVWAVGALLHWMITGVPPGKADGPSLAKIPASLAITIDACLADHPNKRPTSVDEIAEVIGSFSASPPDRFEQLARRKAALENGKNKRKDLVDLDMVFGRLDDAALKRELSVHSPDGQPPSAISSQSAAERLVLTLHRNTGSAVFA